MMGVEKCRVARGGKYIIFRRGGGINIIFGPKYRPLSATVYDNVSLLYFIRNSINFICIICYIVHNTRIICTH
jgi:hypothetical protein